RFVNTLKYIQSRAGGTLGKGKLTIKNTCVEVLRDAIAEIIINDCKSHYILENMKLPIHDNFDRHLFITALCEFDREMDKYLVMEILEISPVFVLSSFYDFKLSNLKKRWDEICLIANDNVENLVVEGNFFELLKYLISNLEQRLDEVFLECIQDEVRLYDRQMKELSISYINQSLPSSMRAVSILIHNNPRKIFFWGGQSEFFDRIKSLFGGCVELPEAKELFNIHSAQV
ncbi:MAG: hypothetical protein FWE31_05165, partial [Firmicutes bacterium]|nr:hypothetical protein [Bacillota bacterium]